MSNAERWDHSGYRELQNEEKSSIVGTKRPVGNKKTFYKYKDGLNLNEKPMISDYMDHSGQRKNINKKFSNFGGVKYNNEEWNCERDKNQENERDSVNSFKNKVKKKKNDDFYPNYEGNDNYYRNSKLNEEGGNNTPPMNLNSSYNSYNSGGISQPHSQNLNTINTPQPHMNFGNNNNLNMPFNQRKKQGINQHNSVNSGIPPGNFNPNPNFYNNKKNMMNSYGNYNTMYNPGPGFNNMQPMNQNFNNQQNNLNKNIVNTPYSNNNFYPHGTPSQGGSQGGSSNNLNNMNISNMSIPSISSQREEIQDPNSKIVMNEDNLISTTQENEISSHQTENVNENTKNKKMARNLVDTIKSNKQIKSINQNSVSETNDTNVSQTDEGVSSVLIKTPQRNSQTSSGNTGSTNIQNTSNTHNSQIHTPGNSVGFSPKNEQIFMCNILKLPNNLNFNSPMRNENFMFQNHPSSARGPPIGINNPYFSMLPGMSPMNAHNMDGSHHVPVNSHLNIHPSGMPSNYNSFAFNGNSGIMKPPTTGSNLNMPQSQPLQNMSKFNSLNNTQMQHDENLENRNSNSGHKKFNSNNNIGSNSNVQNMQNLHNIHNMQNSHNTGNFNYQRTHSSVGTSQNINSTPNSLSGKNQNPFEKNPQSTQQNNLIIGNQNQNVYNTGNRKTMNNPNQINQSQGLNQNQNLQHQVISPMAHTGQNLTSVNQNLSQSNLNANLDGGNFNNISSINNMHSINNVNNPANVGSNNRPYNNRKFNNNNSYMQGTNKNMYKAKFVTSDKFVTGSIKDNRGGNQMNQMGQIGQINQMAQMGQINHNMMNMMGNNMNVMNNPMFSEFSAPRLPNQNKVWRNNSNSSNSYPGNQQKINELTNIINSTIRDPNSNSKSNQNLPHAGSFESIKEELQRKDKINYENLNNYSSGNSDYEMAEEEVKLHNKSSKENFSLYVSIKLNDREEILPVGKNEDVFHTAKNFVIQQKLNSNLVKPIAERIKQALNSIDVILECTLNEKEHQSLSAIQTFYTENKVEEDDDFVNMLDLSCITDIGSPGNYLSDTEDFKKVERLNISR
jgi:hypothetical protein